MIVQEWVELSYVSAPTRNCETSHLFVHDVPRYPPRFTKGSSGASRVSSVHESVLFLKNAPFLPKGGLNLLTFGGHRMALERIYVNLRRPTRKV